MLGPGREFWLMNFDLICASLDRLEPALENVPRSQTCLLASIARILFSRCDNKPQLETP